MPGFAPALRRLTRPGISLCSLPPCARRGLTQKQVAELLGTKQQAIARLEDPTYTGHSLSMVRKYVEALGANLDVTIIPAETTGAYAAQRSPKPLLTHVG